MSFESNIGDESVIFPKPGLCVESFQACHTVQAGRISFAAAVTPWILRRKIPEIIIQIIVPLPWIQYYTCRTGERFAAYQSDKQVFTDCNLGIFTLFLKGNMPDQRNVGGVPEDRKVARCKRR